MACGFSNRVDSRPSSDVHDIILNTTVASKHLRLNQYFKRLRSRQNILTYFAADTNFSESSTWLCIGDQAISVAQKHFQYRYTRITKKINEAFSVLVSYRLQYEISYESIGVFKNSLLDPMDVVWCKSWSTTFVTRSVKLNFKLIQKLFSRYENQFLVHLLRNFFCFLRFICWIYPKTRRRPYSIFFWGYDEVSRKI